MNIPGASRTVLLLLLTVLVSVTSPAAVRFVGPTSSQPLALSADGSLLLVANAESNTVSLFNVKNDANTLLAKIKVGKEPNGVAVMPAGDFAYVANTVSGTVSVIKLSGATSAVIKTIKVGTEPYPLALTPNGTKLYVGNTRSATVSVIDTVLNKVVKTISNVGFEPRGLGVSNDGDVDDTDETLYVTQFISTPAAGKIDGFDDAKRGHLFAISTANDEITGQIALNPIADTGFKAQGDALRGIPPGPDFVFTTAAYPNQLNNVAIKGD